ncbi:hypothetical protein CAPTEDRAFT_204482 [Capitella teleta]|uniref:F5/8 type C domain-containing protein n=1 Tax=Capitella teleta TaxID=283909 RepID=R7TKD8_CAPTE|nr:hypothetical protein CAPTEDRAFT_204482 [Capitella teleta]|eukprot:ELT91580.1 hypothetical protein CAPTEDRAFT_204482 [Capitella teleta]
MWPRASLALLVFCIVRLTFSFQCIGYAPLIEGSDCRLYAPSPYSQVNTAADSTWTSGSGYRPTDANKDDTWIEVDLKADHVIGGVVTWPMNDPDQENYVQTFRLQHRREDEQMANYRDAEGNIQIFTGNQNNQENVVLNEFRSPIKARYVRLMPVTYSNTPGLRWELLGCNRYVLPHGVRSANASECGTVPTECISAHRLQLEWTGLVTELTEVNVVIKGRSLTCNHFLITMGITEGAIGCNTEYALCKIDESGEEGICHATCTLSGGQVAQPFNLMLLLTGDPQTELCSIEPDLNLKSVQQDSCSLVLGQARRVISDWSAFMQDVSGLASTPS